MPAITDPNEPYFKDGAWGWDGTVWRKLALVFGFSEHHSEQVFTLNAAVGSQSIGTTPVPPGEVLRIEAVSAYNLDRAGTSITFTLRGGTAITGFMIDNSPAMGIYSMWQGLLTLAEGNYINAYFTGTVAGDDLFLQVWGYKMLIAE